MTIQTSTLRPGLLVSLKTSLVGNVKYFSREIEAEHTTEDGAAKARWETERTVSDAVEYEAGKKVRAKTRALISAACSISTFGLLCPEENADVLEKAIAEAHKTADEFNATAKLSRVHVYILTGRVASNDVEAVKAINSEVRGLLEDMERGIANIDVKMIREAASQAKQLGSMLSSEAEARVRIAIDTARDAAKDIVKANGSQPPTVDQSAMRKIAEQRTAFLDLDDAKEVATPMLPRARLDLE